MKPHSSMRSEFIPKSLTHRERVNGGKGPDILAILVVWPNSPVNNPEAWRVCLHALSQRSEKECHS